MRETAVGFDAVGPQVRLIPFGHDQCAFAGPEYDSVGVDVIGDHSFVSFRINGPDASACRVGDKQPEVTGDNQVVACDVRGDDGVVAIRVVGHHLFVTVSASVQSSVAAEHQSVGTSGLFGKDCDLSGVRVDAVDAVVGNVGEEDIAITVDRGSFSEPVAATDKLPVFAGHQDL